MKKLSKKILVLLLTLVTVISGITVINADDDVRPDSVTKIVSSHKNIKVGTEFELTAITEPFDADDDELRWKIVGKKGIVAFEDNDHDDDEVEMIALKAGKTKVRCYVKGKGKKSSKTITITVNADLKKSKISKVGKKTKTVEVGDDFELEVKKSKGLKDKFLKWSIKNKSIVDFDDEDRRGDEIELDAKKLGKTTVTCTNTKTKKKVKYTIIVVADIDDDDDDDSDD